MNPDNPKFRTPEEEARDALHSREAAEVNRERITHAAVLTEDRGWPILGKSHAECFIKGENSGFAMSSRALDQGFITSRGRFVTRADAYFVALEARQITRKPGGILISEMLWADNDALFDYDHVKGYY